MLPSAIGRKMLFAALHFTLYFVAYDWLIGGSNWLIFVLATSSTSLMFLHAEVTESRQLFAIADAELVRVWALVDAQVEEINELRSRLEMIESKASDESC